MKTCPFCKEHIKDDAIKCRYCSSTINDKKDFKAYPEQHVVYVLDRGLIRYAKFVISILAVFLVVGAFFYGFNLKQTTEEINEVKDKTIAIRDEMESRIKIIEKMESAISKREKKTRDILRIIQNYSEEARIKLASIENDSGFDNSKIQMLIWKEFVEHLHGILPPEKVENLKKRLVPEHGTFAEIRNQPALKLIRVQQAINESDGVSSVKVALLSDRVSTNIVQLEGKIIGTQNYTQETPSGQATAAAVLIAAIAPRAKILAVNIIESSGRYSTISDTSIARGINYAIENEARIIVMPFVSIAPNSSKINLLLKKAREQNILLISSSGNNSSDRKSYPAANPDVIAVTTTDNNDRKADFSSYGDWCSIAAPGVDILSFDYLGRFLRIRGGTFSTAIVSGIAALVLSVRPDLSVDEIENVLKEGAVDITKKNLDFKGLLGAGRVDALSAVSLAKKIGNKG